MIFDVQIAADFYTSKFFSLCFSGQRKELIFLFIKSSIEVHFVEQIIKVKYHREQLFRDARNKRNESKSYASLYHLT